MTTQRIYAAASASHVSEQELYHRGRSNRLRARGVLRPTDRVNNCGGFLHVAVFADGGEEVSGLQELILRDAGNAFDHFRRIPRVLLPEQLEDAPRMLQREVVCHILRQVRRRGRLAIGPRCGFGCCCRCLRRAGWFSAQVTALFVIPSGFVIDLRGGIKTRVKPVLRKLEAILHHESGIRVIDQVLLGDAVVFDRVVNDSAQKRDVRSGANLAEKIRHRGRSRKARINHDDFGVAHALRFDGPFESAGMILGGITAHDQHHVCIFDVDPTIRHCAPAERWSQT